MSIENEDNQPARSTVGRTIRLSTDVLGRLQAVCDHLGVTVGAYLTQEVGRSVARDEVSLMAKHAKDSSLEILTKFLTEAARLETCTCIVTEHERQESQSCPVHSPDRENAGA